MSPADVATTETSTAAWLALMRVRGVGPKTLPQLHQKNARLGRSMWELVSGAKPPSEDDAGEARTHLEGAVEEVHRLLERGIEVITLEDEKYPQALNMAGAPPVLFVQGDVELLKPRAAAAVVGSRHAPENALRIARTVAFELARSDVNVVSGYASGIDTEAHLGALEADGSTTLVLPFGIDHFEWKRPFKQFAGNGHALVLSTFPPRLRWSAHAAMERNRYVCALANAVLVVAAAANGGTMNTAKEAAESGKDLFVVDFGDDGDESFAGNRELLAKGAHAVRRRRLSGEPNLDELIEHSAISRKPEAPQGSLPL